MIGFTGALNSSFHEPVDARTEAARNPVFCEGLGARLRSHEWYSAVTKCCAVGVFCAALTTQHAGVVQFIAAPLIMAVLWLLDCHYLARAQAFECIYRDIVPIGLLDTFDLNKPSTKALCLKTFAFNWPDGAYYAATALLASLVLVP